MVVVVVVVARALHLHAMIEKVRDVNLAGMRRNCCRLLELADAAPVVPEGVAP